MLFNLQMAQKMRDKWRGGEHDNEAEQGRDDGDDKMKRM